MAASEQDYSCDEDDSDSQDGSSMPLATGPEAEEKSHFLEVCYSFVWYANDCMYDLGKLQETIQELGPLEKELWKVDPMQWYNEIKQRIAVNSQFCNMFPCADICSADLGPNADQIVSMIPSGHRVASRNSSKVRSTLRQFVRDWAKEGQPERQASYSPLISALLQHLPPPKQGTQQRAPAVLCPGCGLARLPFDLVRLGYAAQGNEFSYHMLLGSNLILNRSERPECFSIFPFALSLPNRKGRWDHLRAVKIPDICPMDALRQGAQFSMAAGEFVEVYKNQTNAWDAVASCFFLDTAKNIFLYIRIIANIIRPGGLFVNIGPLLFHYADSPNDVSIEISWEEVKPCLLQYFDIVEESEKIALYTANSEGLSCTRYRCIFFVARRNNVAVNGRSNPVY